MEYTTIISFITSVGMIGSMILNWVQYRSGKKGVELTNFEKQIEILVKLQDLKDEKYQNALKCKDLEIESLKKDIKSMKEVMEKTNEKVIVLQNAVNKLIGGGCKRMQCQSRIPYPADEIGNVLGIIDTTKEE